MIGDGSNIALTDVSQGSVLRFTFYPIAYTPSILHNIQWMGARYFSSGRQGNDWMALVIHITECTSLQEIADTFWGTRRGSAHFGVGNDGIQQYVGFDDAAWAVGNWQWNLRTVSIEHVGTTGNPPTQETLDRSSRLMAALARQKGWTKLVMGANVGIHQ